MNSVMTGVWSALFSSVFIWSAIAPKDYFTWLLEVSPALIAVVLLWAKVSPQTRHKNRSKTKR
jgi:uncharacterized membrane protein YjdF